MVPDMVVEAIKGCPQHYKVDFIASSDERIVLTIVAVTVEVHDCGFSPAINANLYEVAPSTYIGGQPMSDKYL